MTGINMNECRLCLKIVHDDNFHKINEITSQMLNTLLLKVNLDKHKESVMCLECAMNLQNAVDFKTNCLNAQSKLSTSIDIENDVNPLSKKEILKNNSGLELNDISKEGKVCQFCNSLTESGSCAYSQDTKESVFMIDVVQKHIPELHLSLTRERVTCDACISSLQSISTFITVCTETEGKFKEKNQGTGNGQFNLKDSKDLPLKFENVADIGDNYSNNVEYITVKNEVKCEDCVEVDNLNLNIKNEEIDIKLEGDDCESVTYNCERKLYTCEQCSFKTEHKRSLKTHWLTHQHHPEVTLYKHVRCSFNTRSKYNLENHILTHQCSAEIETYSCNRSFKTEITKSLKTHHSSQASSDLSLFTCKQSSYNTKHEYNIKKHHVVHQKPLDITMYKCEICSYESKNKSNVTIHMLVHQNPAEIKMYNCESCTYVTKRKGDLKNHQSKWHYTPSNESFCIMYECKSCTYAAQKKSTLKIHMLTHQSPCEVDMYRCEICSFESKYKHTLKRHHLIKHSQTCQSLPVTMFKCANCLYSTNRKGTLKKHMLIHHSRLEVEMYKCGSCSYASNQKGNLRRHLLVHQKSCYHCESCSFETNHKWALKTHQLNEHTA